MSPPFIFPNISIFSPPHGKRHKRNEKILHFCLCDLASWSFQRERLKCLWHWEKSRESHSIWGIFYCRCRWKLSLKACHFSRKNIPGEKCCQRQSPVSWQVISSVSKWSVGHSVKGTIASPGSNQVLMVWNKERLSEVVTLSIALKGLVFNPKVSYGDVSCSVQSFTHSVNISWLIYDLPDTVLEEDVSSEKNVCTLMQFIFQ